MLGHAEAVLAVAFAPQGDMLATASGDGTVRLWDMGTDLPLYTLKGHTDWVLCISWSPDGHYLASGSMDNDVRIWNAKV